MSLAAVDRLRPDLVLLALGRAHGCGIAILRRMREPHHHQCDVLVTVDSPNAGLVATLHRLGVIGCLVQPLRESDLRARVRSWLVTREVVGPMYSAQQVDQAEVDRMLATTQVAHSERAAPSNTLEMVANVLREAGAGLSAADTANRCGLSSVAARRYLKQLVALGEVTASTRYQSTGRPTVLYQWIC